MKRLFIAGIVATAFAVVGLIHAPAGAQEGNWGTLKGKIVWGDKDIPQPQLIKVVGNNPDKVACEKDGPLFDEQWVVNKKNKGLRWTFVWLAQENPKNKDPLPIHPSLQNLKQKEVVIDQPICMFRPHAIGMREGQVLVAKNSAGFAHNFKWTGLPGTPNEGNNVLMPAGGKFEIKGLVADRLPIKIECNIHPWMNGWVRVFNHPYYAVTDADGAFEMPNAPAGDYRLVVWHGSGGWLGGAKGKNGQEIKIKAGGTTDLGSIEYPPPGN